MLSEWGRTGGWRSEKNRRHYCTGYRSCLSLGAAREGRTKRGSQAWTWGFYKNRDRREAGGDQQARLTLAADGCVAAWSKTKRGTDVVWTSGKADVESSREEE